MRSQAPVSAVIAVMLLGSGGSCADAPPTAPQTVRQLAAREFDCPLDQVEVSGSPRRYWVEICAAEAYWGWVGPVSASYRCDSSQPARCERTSNSEAPGFRRGIGSGPWRPDPHGPMRRALVEQVQRDLGCTPSEITEMENGRFSVRRCVDGGAPSLESTLLYFCDAPPARSCRSAD